MICFGASSHLFFTTFFSFGGAVDYNPSHSQLTTPLTCRGGGLQSPEGIQPYCRAKRKSLCRRNGRHMGSDRLFATRKAQKESSFVLDCLHFWVCETLSLQTLDERRDTNFKRYIKNTHAPTHPDTTTNDLKTANERANSLRKVRNTSGPGAMVINCRRNTSKGKT